MLYSVDGSLYSLSYQQLKETHHRFMQMSDDEFFGKLTEVLHLSCIISYLKELEGEQLVSDKGLIHLIAHQMHIPSGLEHEKLLLREKFNSLLKLS